MPFNALNFDNSDSPVTYARLRGYLNDLGFKLYQIKSPSTGRNLPMAFIAPKSDMDATNPAVRVLRNAIVSTHNSSMGNVLAFSMPMGQVGEPTGDTVSTPIYDGLLVRAWYNHHIKRWQLSTNRKIDIQPNVGISKLVFRYVNLKKLDKNYTHLYKVQTVNDRAITRVLVNSVHYIAKINVEIGSCSFVSKPLSSVPTSVAGKPVPSGPVGCRIVEQDTDLVFNRFSDGYKRADELLRRPYTIQEAIMTHIISSTNEAELNEFIDVMPQHAQLFADLLDRYSKFRDTAFEYAERFVTDCISYEERMTTLDNPMCHLPHSWKYAINDLTNQIEKETVCSVNEYLTFLPNKLRYGDRGTSLTRIFYLNRNLDRVPDVFEFGKMPVKREFELFTADRKARETKRAEHQRVRDEKASRKQYHRTPSKTPKPASTNAPRKKHMRRAYRPSGAGAGAGTGAGAGSGESTE